MSGAGEDWLDDPDGLPVVLARGTQKRLALQGWQVHCLLLILGVVCGLAVLPQEQHDDQQIRQQLPELQANGGWQGRQTLSKNHIDWRSVTEALKRATPANQRGPTCGKPGEVFQRLGLPQTRIPNRLALMRLPRPVRWRTLQSGEMSYDPAANELCMAGNAGPSKGLEGLMPAVTSSPGYMSGEPSTSWIMDILKGVGQTLFQWISDALKRVIDWAMDFGFMFVTPHRLTYDHPVVKNLYHWVLGLLDGLVALILVIGGYNYMFGRYDGFRELAPRIIIAAIAANFSLYFLQQAVDLHNALCSGVQQVLATAGVGDLNFPKGTFDSLTAPLYEIIAYLLELILGVMLSLQMLVRLALLDLLIVLAPLGLLCFALPQTLVWGRLWAQSFVATLIVQFLQVVCVGLGSTLIGSFGHSSFSAVGLLVGVAAMYLAFKLPSMLLSNVLGSSVGAVNNQAMGAVRSVTGLAGVHL